MRPSEIAVGGDAVRATLDWGGYRVGRTLTIRCRDRAQALVDLAGAPCHMPESSEDRLWTWSGAFMRLAAAKTLEASSTTMKPADAEKWMKRCS